MLKLLDSKSVDLHATNTDGLSILHCAARGKYFKCAKFLLSKQVKLDPRSTFKLIEDSCGELEIEGLAEEPEESVMEEVD